MWLKVKSLKVENTSFWKVKCYEALELMNQISLQTTKINKVIAKSLILLVLATCMKNLWIGSFNLVFFILHFLEWSLMQQF
jgi:hypothetical protein